MKLDEFEIGQLRAGMRRERRPWPKQPAGLVLSRNNPPCRQLRSRRGGLDEQCAALARRSTPVIALSSTMSPRASVPSSSVIDGHARTAAISARKISRPVPSPVACTIRFLLCAASSPSRQPPSGRRSKPTPSRARCSTAAGAAWTIRLAISPSQRPAPAAMVSATCRAGSSSSPIAAASPPCAHRLEASAPSGAFDNSTTGSGARCSAVISPAAPPPMMMARPARVEKSAVILPASFRRCAGRDRRSQDRFRPGAGRSPARGGCSSA